MNETNQGGTQELKKETPKLTVEIIAELRRLLHVAHAHAEASENINLTDIDPAPLYEALGALEGFAPQLLDLAEQQLCPTAKNLFTETTPEEQ